MISDLKTMTLDFVRNERLLVVVICCASVLASLSWLVYVLASAGLRFQETGSAPKSALFVVDLGDEPLRRGMRVAVCLEGEVKELALDRGYVGRVAGNIEESTCGSGLKAIWKLVYGLPGDSIDLYRLPRPLPHDSMGRPLPAADSGFVPEGHVWLRSEKDSRAAFDSKYYGPAPIGWVKKAIVPIFPG